MGSYVPSTPAQRQEMLEAIGLHDFRQLYRDVPEEMLLRDGLDLPEGMSELEVSRTMTAMAARNTAYSAVLRGAGAYDHYIPSLVKYVPAKEEFLTAYTPYQAEMSQGILQSIFEYQTMICQLTGMDVSNASVYAGATPAAEAAARANAGDDTAINRDSIGRIIHGLIDEMDDGTGWVRTSRVGDQLIKRYPDFDVRNFGSKSLNKFLASLPELEVEERILANGNPIQFVRVKPVPKPVKKPAPRRTAKRTTRKKK